MPAGDQQLQPWQEHSSPFQSFFAEEYKIHKRIQNNAKRIEGKRVKPKFVKLYNYVGLSNFNG